MYRIQVLGVADRISKQALGPSLGVCRNPGSESYMAHVSPGSAGEYQADWYAGVAWLSWRVSGR